MRSFDDALGNRWEAALLDASYGSIMLVFSSFHDGGDIHQQLMPAENMAEAEAQLASFGEEELRTLLSQSQPWDSGSRSV